jgi:hypothetical protein
MCFKVNYAVYIYYGMLDYIGWIVYNGNLGSELSHPISRQPLCF